jgi:hypothetical protein
MKSKNQAFLPPEELFTAICQLLQEGYDAEFTVTGNSMWPFLAHRRDSVTLHKPADTPLKRGDIVLLQTEQGYLLHRITALKNGMLQTTGDYNCYRDAYVSRQCVLGKVVRFTRKGKQVSCTAPWYRVCSWLWRVLFPLRPLLLRVLFWFRRRKE